MTTTSRSSNLAYLLLLLLFFIILFHKPTAAFSNKKSSYVVYLGGHTHKYNEDVSDLHELQTSIKESHYTLLSSFLGSREDAEDAIFYSYTKHINGFAAILHHNHALGLAKHPSVVSVFPNQGRKLHTTRSWKFMGLEKSNGFVPFNSIWNKSHFGQHTIIANLDTGVWPESKSFGDEGMGPIPSRWKGICENDTNPAGVTCNRKLIGARYFNKGYLAALGTSNSSSSGSSIVSTPRDYDGHGTHTLSTAGGMFVPGANVFGKGKGTAKGGSPLARVVAYKVCWPPINDGNECFDADIIAAFDAAIADGVDVISASLGGDPTTFFNDSLSIGSFHATIKGISVVCSAGNSGPQYGTVSNVSPWMLTVAASTMDREFTSWVILSNNMQFKGQSLAPKSLLPRKFYSILSGEDARASNVSALDANLCKAGTLDKKKAKGKIVVCLRGENARVNKGEQVLLVGGVGMVLVNDITTANELVADAHLLPTSHITYNDGLALYTFLNSTKSPKASITAVKTRLGTKPAPLMAAFSSKGPNTVTPQILKPDITAPGVSVIAAYTGAQGPTDQDFDKRRVQFNSISGTSMSCPHVSGIVGLLKTLYPHWSPAAIKSAIMTTASMMDNMKEPILNSSNTKADPFSYGAGHVRPNQAMDPGLVYDLTMKDYLNFLCALGYNRTSIALFTDKPYTCSSNSNYKSRGNIVNLNYPSITIPNLKGSITVARTTKNVGSPGTYTAHVASPPGIKVSVKPKRLVFERKGDEKTYYVTIKVKSNAHASKGSYVFGRLTWSDGVHYVTSPLVVRAM